MISFRWPTYYNFDRIRVIIIVQAIQVRIMTAVIQVNSKLTFGSVIFELLTFKDCFWKLALNVISIRFDALSSVQRKFERYDDVI